MTTLYDVILTKLLSQCKYSRFKELAVIFNFCIELKLSSLGIWQRLEGTLNSNNYFVPRRGLSKDA
jgi:hypothetical protein